MHPVEKTSIFSVSPFSASVKGRAPSSFAFIADPSISVLMASNSEWERILRAFRGDGSSDVTGHGQVEGKHAGQVHPQSVASVILPHPVLPSPCYDC